MKLGSIFAPIARLTRAMAASNVDDPGADMQREEAAIVQAQAKGYGWPLFEMPRSFAVQERPAIAEEKTMSDTNNTLVPANPAAPVSGDGSGGTAAASSTGILTKIEDGFNIAEAWIVKISDKVAGFFKKVETVEPAVASGLVTIVTKTEAFLAASTPAVAGEGLNFPADSVAYGAFVDLVKSWQAEGAIVVAALKSLEGN